MVAIAFLDTAIYILPVEHPVYPNVRSNCDYDPGRMGFKFSNKISSCNVIIIHCNKQSKINEEVILKQFKVIS